VLAEWHIRSRIRCYRGTVGRFARRGKKLQSWRNEPDQTLHKLEAKTVAPHPADSTECDAWSAPGMLRKIQGARPNAEDRAEVGGRADEQIHLHEAAGVMGAQSELLTPLTPGRRGVNPGWDFQEVHSTPFHGHPLTQTTTRGSGFLPELTCARRYHWARTGRHVTQTVLFTPKTIRPCWMHWLRRAWSGFFCTMRIGWRAAWNSDVRAS
jgi:hypothetical protein